MNRNSDPTPQTRRLLRATAKWLLFVARGVRPGTAWWLAQRDATKRNDYRAIPLGRLQSAWQADPTWRDIVAAKGEARSRLLDLAFTERDIAAEDYATLVGLKRQGFAISRAATGLVLQNEMWNVHLGTAEQVSMAREIFLEGCYAVRLSGRWAVMDIGANAGLASLYFAAQEWVDHVVAFEPFAATATEFTHNLNRNPQLAGKITLHTYGISDRDGRATVAYARQLSGSMSVNGVGAWRGNPRVRTEPAEILLRQASTTVAEFQAQYPAHRRLVKIDCEGSEFPIIRDLAASGLLSALDVVIIEWHDRGPEELTARLREWGYDLHVRPLCDDCRLGIIVAWKSHPR